MSLALGIVGLPNVGKSTLFNALLKREAALAANYPFATIEPNIGVVDVPDNRLEVLANHVEHDYKQYPEKIIPATVKFYDIAGLVKGASEGEGLGNKFLSHIREVDAVVHLVRAFTDTNVVREGSVSPKDDIQIINTELILADLQTLESRMEKHQKNLKSDKNAENLKKAQLYEVIYKKLSEGNLALEANLSDDESLLVKDLNLLTLKPVLYVYNVDESALAIPFENLEAVKGLPYGTIISAKIESELSSLSKDDQELYMKDLGISESGLDKVIKKGYELLQLQTFLTAGPKEVRAWTIKRGMKAPQAAGVIHTDFERGFIKAEILSFDDLIKAQGFKNAKEQGLLRLEGKDYVMKEGDIVEFKFNV